MNCDEVGAESKVTNLRKQIPNLKAVDFRRFIMRSIHSTDALSIATRPLLTSQAVGVIDLWTSNPSYSKEPIDPRAKLRDKRSSAW